jgi:hypothetical protein
MNPADRPRNRPQAKKDGHRGHGAGEAWAPVGEEVNHYGRVLPVHVYGDLWTGTPRPPLSRPRAPGPAKIGEAPMVRYLALVATLAALMAPAPKADDGADSRALATIKKLGGRFSRGDVPGGPVVHVVLSTCKATDADLAQLKNFKQLESLYLAQTQITDAGLAHLKSLERLEYLALNETGITGAGLAGAVWLVTGTNGGNRIEARGETQAEAWHRAAEQAEAVGMLARDRLCNAFRFCVAGRG